MSQPEPMHRVNINVPQELWEQFKDVAHANYRSRSDHLRFLMAQAVFAHALGRSPQFIDLDEEQPDAAK